MGISLLREGSTDAVNDAGNNTFNASITGDAGKAPYSIERIQLQNSSQRSK